MAKFIIRQYSSMEGRLGNVPKCERRTSERGGQVYERRTSVREEDKAREDSGGQ